MGKAKKTEIRRIGIYSSGGDAPGMNAAIRAVVRTAFNQYLHIYGIEYGYEGMIEGNIKRLDTKDVICGINGNPWSCFQRTGNNTLCP